MKRFVFYIFFMCVAIVSHSQNAVDTSELSATAKLLLNKTYQFNATTVQPMTGRERNIAGNNYTLKISTTSIIADLPYFGKSNSAPIGTNDVGMKFTSGNFDYINTEMTKSREQVIIKPKDVNNVQEVYLIIYPDGTADLRINSVSRQAISYRGKIEALK